MTDNLTRQQRSSIMSRVQGGDTKPKIALCKALHHRVLRHGKSLTTLHGTPDIVFNGARIAVFVDGDFWHSWHCRSWRQGLSGYWNVKTNRARDAKNWHLLSKMGWKVIRVREHGPKENRDECVTRVEKEVRKREDVTRHRKKAR